jgi:UDPglucose--hexose-1-phosphate uridylyltransferase
MVDFQFLKNPLSKKWVISAPRRAKRPDVANGTEPSCPFCPEHNQDKELYRVGGEKGDTNWEIKVIPNKFPFAPIHELIIDTPDHHTSFDTFSKEHIERLITVYRHRFNEHSASGQVYIFHNHGEKAGESIPHSHTQLAVIPDKVLLEIPRLQSVAEDMTHGLTTTHFTLFCPTTANWPDEVWVAPKKSGRVFGEITDTEIADIAGIIKSLAIMFDLRYNKDFPYNFYLYPGGDWYFRLIPRLKTLGGFEVGTNVIVNTQKPQETMEFIKEHFGSPNIDKILKEQQADYHHRV